VRAFFWKKIDKCNHDFVHPQLNTGRNVETVTSMKPGILHFESSRGPLEMIDFPGHQRLQGYRFAVHVRFSEVLAADRMIVCATQSFEAAAQEGDEGYLHGRLQRDDIPTSAGCRVSADSGSYG
jgi:hypothetical protein